MGMRLRIMMRIRMRRIRMKRILMRNTRICTNG
jgi:hypothetical protein